jgi:hypothetical protein
MAKKNETTVLILAAVAVAGYFAFKKGLFSPAIAAPAVQPGTAMLPPPNYAIQDPHSVAVELPTFKEIGIYAPALDPTGRSITLY